MWKKPFFILALFSVLSCQQESDPLSENSKIAKNRYSSARVRAACPTSSHVTNLLQNPKAQDIYTADSRQWFMLNSAIPITWDASVINGSQAMIVIDANGQVIFGDYVPNTGQYNYYLVDFHPTSATGQYHITVSSPSSCVYENCYFNVYRD